MLELDSVHLKRSGMRIIQNLNFCTNKNRVAVVGNNGSGKTTLLLAISGLLPCASGKININGAHCARRRRRLTGVFSNAIHPPGYLCAKKIINLSARNLSKKLDEFEQKFLSSVNLRTTFDNLSEGGQRKVGIVFALRNEKGSVILDEPYNALDKQSALLLKEYLNDYMGMLIYADHTKSELSAQEDVISL